MSRTREFYNRFSHISDFLAEPFEGPLRNEALNRLAPQKGERILEIGVGTGQGLLALAKAVGPSGRVYGIDVAEEMIQRSQSLLQREKLADRVELTCGDAIQLPYSDHFFHALFMSFTLELFENPAPLLQQCRRVLKDKGRIGVVGLSASKKTVASRIYLWFHHHFPETIDCRPIPIAATLKANGFEIQSTVEKRLTGIPIEIVIAQSSDPDTLRA